MLVFVGKQFACVKIIGRANFTFALDFQALVTGLQQKGCAYFVLDLAECLIMDSTFLGVLAGFGLKMTGADAGQNRHAVELLNPSPRVAELLENLGILPLFKIVRASPGMADATEACVPEPAHPSRAEVARACLEAHQTLMAINPENVPKFKDVAQFLAEDLKKLENCS